MPRLPQPGKDNGTWGEILNDFLGESHNQDGSLKAIDQAKVTNLTANLAAKASQSTTYTKTEVDSAFVTQDAFTSGIESKANTANVYSKSDADTRFAAIDQIGLRVVYHAANANFARPATTASVLWVGSVNPANIIANDLYFHSTALPPPQVYLFDDYNRADGAPGLTPTGGFAIATTGGSVVAIQGNALGFSTIPGTHYAYYITGHRVARHKWVLGASQSDALNTLIFRFSSTTNHFLLARVSSTVRNYRFMKRVGSASPVEIAVTSVPMTAGDIIEVLDATDGTVTILINSVQVYSGIQSELLANTGIGIGGGTTSAAFTTTVNSLESKELP